MSERTAYSGPIRKYLMQWLGTVSWSTVKRMKHKDKFPLHYYYIAGGIVPFVVHEEVEAWFREREK